MEWPDDTFQVVFSILLPNKKGGQISLHIDMEKQIKELGQSIMKVLPGGASALEENDSLIIRYSIQAGAKGANIQIIIKPKFVIIKGSQTYPFEAKIREQNTFNDEVKQNYPDYQIYGSGKTLSINKRFLYEFTDHLLDDMSQEISKFNSIIREVVTVYEQRCINFMSKLIRDEEKYDPTANTFIDSEPVLEVETNENIDEFNEKQKKLAKSVFEDLARKLGCEKEHNHGQSFISTKTEDGQMFVRLNDTDAMLEFEYHIPIKSSSNAYIIIANLNSAYHEIAASYESEELTITAYLVPDQFIPQQANELYQSIVNAFRECSDSDDIDQTDDIQILADLQKVVEKQAEELLEKERELSAREQLCADRESQLDEEYQKLAEEQSRLEEQVQDNDRIFKERLHSLDEKEKQYEKNLSEMDSEKAKYLIGMQNLSTKVAHLKTRLNDSGSSDKDQIEISRLNAKIQSLIQARTSMERSLSTEINDLKRKNQELFATLREKEEEFEKMQEETHEKISQEFDEQKAEFESQITALRIVADITGNEIKIEEFMNFLDMKNLYDGLKILHARNKDILSFSLDNGKEVKVVFGDPLFFDVSKIIKNKEMKTLQKLNETISEAKFFSREDRIVARRYFGKLVNNSELEEMILDIGSLFK